MMKEMTQYANKTRMAEKYFLAILVLVFFSCNAFAQNNLKYVDAAGLTIIGKPIPTTKPFTRIDTSVFKFNKSFIDRKAAQSTGLAICFRTDSKNLRAKWKTGPGNSGANMTAIGQKGLDLYIRDGGEWEFAGVGVPKMSGHQYDQHESDLALNMKDGEKECLLYLPLFDSVEQLYIGIDADSSIEPMDNPFSKRIVFVGSSITHGASASRPGMCYVALYGRKTGYYCMNLGFSGDSKLQEEYARYLAEVDADAFVFDAFSNPSPEEISDRFDKFVDIIREAHPDTPLIFLQTEWREKRRFNTKIDALEAEKQRIARQEVISRRESDKNIWFVDSEGYLGNDGLGTADGVHPTDLGFIRWVDRMYPQLKKIFRRYSL